MRGGRGPAWLPLEDAEILNGLAQGKTAKGIAKQFPRRSLFAVERRIKVLTGGKDTRPSGVPVRLSMRIPQAFYDVWKLESELLGMTFSRYIREKLFGGR